MKWALVIFLWVTTFLILGYLAYLLPLSTLSVVLLGFITGGYVAALSLLILFDE